MGQTSDPKLERHTDRQTESQLVRVETFMGTKTGLGRPKLIVKFPETQYRQISI